MENSVQNISRAKILVDEILPLVEGAENNFKSARNWSLIDIFGGGMLTDVIKHIKLNSASEKMNGISWKLNELQQVLGNIQIPVDYRMQLGGFSTFADFVFDGAIADIYMSSKIFKSLDTVRDLKNKLIILKERLNQL